jgi:spore coat protein A, manganese oxidase
MTTFTRKQLLQYGAVGGAAAFVPWRLDPEKAFAAMGGQLTKYVEHVPLPGAGIVVAGQSAANTYSFTDRQISRRLHPQLPPTPFWAYDDGSGLAGQAGSFGMALVAEKGTPLTVQFRHDLPSTYPAWIPVDTRLVPLANEVRVMTHLHGGFVAGASDGNPGVTPNGFGPGETQTVHYPNEQPATLLWFHDHAMGATRLNVFAGLAAGYILRDQYDTGEPGNANGLPSGPYEVPLVIQDRQFNADGTFRYPMSDIPGVTWIGEYFGDAMLVNGKVWPYLEVEPRLYRLRILNGCNSRILTLNFAGATMWQIGAEGGLFDKPVEVKTLVMAPAERADVLVDFGPLAGKTLVVTNSKPPKPVVTPAPNLSQVMQIRVAAGTRVRPTIPTTLAGGTRASLPNPNESRFITLNEIGVDTPDWELTLNGIGFFEEDHVIPPTEEVRVGSVEDWYWVNLTGDTHPMHTHLFMHQVVGRVPFDAQAYTDAAIAAGFGGPDGLRGGFDPRPFATGPMIAPASSERGFKDTTKANPGQFTIIRGRFDLPSGVTAPQDYVYHCHIVEHEDNEMMRPFRLVS